MSRCEYKPDYRADCGACATHVLPKSGRIHGPDLWHLCEKHAEEVRRTAPNAIAELVVAL